MKKTIVLLVCFLFGIAIINSCKKEPVIPTLTTAAVTNITINSGTSGGVITKDGGAGITARGVCWGTAPNPTISGSYTTDDKGTGSFTSNITDLTPNTPYHVRAYATNKAGTAYGNDVTFTTTPIVVPTLTTTAVTAITATTAVSGGNITADGNGVISASGVCWSTAANPTTDDPKTTGTTATGAFVSNLTGLLPGTAYHVRAYATNSAGTAYGTDVPFTTTVAIPTLTTTAVTSITLTTAVSGGNITANGGGVISASGVCWSTAANPTIADPKTTGTTATGAFVSNLTGLLPGTAYHVRAYATNSAGTAYGSDIPFTTTVAIPTLTTAAVTVITQTTAVSGGNITTNGGGVISASGVCWSTAANPTTADPKTTGTTATGDFVSNLTGLLPGTAYHVRAYATNSAGTAYGSDVPFTTSSIGVATLSTTAVTVITQTTAISGGNITANGGGVISASGVCWSTAANPTIADPKTTGTTVTGAFVSNLTGLLPGTAYHVRAYATNSAGTAYGADVPFTTLVAIPTLTTTAVSSITTTTAVSGGNITANGGGVISASGVCWSTAANPTIADPKTTGTTVTGTFVSNLTGLLPGTAYHVRAYATNSAGTAYGADVPFTTLVAIPTLTTTAVSSITTTTAVSGGNITANGGGVISASGVCWTTAANPTIADPKTTGTTVTGTFVSNLTGLLPGTAYHVRAYATNGAGTAYGSDVPFTTTAAGIPTLTTTAVTSITLTTAVSGGSISSNGGALITVSGICWSTTTNPTIGVLNTTTDGTTTGSFSSTMTGLSAGATYYVRAYATNSAGTAYGNQQSFITNHESGTLTDNDGHTYITVKIGTQWWMAEDLKTTKYSNGNLIGTTTLPTTDISAEATPSYQWPVDGNEGNVATYGRLYTWFTVIDARNICPTGWHVPADGEWETLKTNIGGDLVAGGKLKEAGTTHWQTPNTGATNETGFTALPGGYRTLNGAFVSLQISSYHWSSTQNPTPAWGWGQHMYYNDGVLLRGGYEKKDGVAVRCLMN